MVLSLTPLPGEALFYDAFADTSSGRLFLEEPPYSSCKMKGIPNFLLTSSFRYAILLQESLSRYRDTVKIFHRSILQRNLQLCFARDDLAGQDHFL